MWHGTYVELCGGLPVGEGPPLNRLRRPTYSRYARCESRPFNVLQGGGGEGGSRTYTSHSAPNPKRARARVRSTVRVTSAIRTPQQYIRPRQHPAAPPPPFCLLHLLELNNLVTTEPKDTPCKSTHPCPVSPALEPLVLLLPICGDCLMRSCTRTCERMRTRTPPE